MRTIEHPGYRARNMSVKNAERLNGLLCDTLKRMHMRQDCPLWLADNLYGAIESTNSIIFELRKHRDELPETLEIP